ncbi:Conserved oligomeric Golgi complex subunit 6 [Taphrina deformans PYCC 5710]|uniref:Conserved oligomeric Golgi complex subunit 6 n=1 Tax=Taphrina deformans (strain PYCC 5710 / ATCC 11124 / CBS 356.35 / IMI 108563 / JCM 9778 / NBRC 8474) TaxID=1097556 RepID=R4XC07_TAPDE|nr:Conserved oligomeric Golgi complex subunit 6 [Taphrina deformans PYCC 5710]|eukprot:CCG80875.1 Conserved oligomeric Golgi complex subunit 6 [Taphrina deformans PYCC 5710]
MPRFIAERKYPLVHSGPPPTEMDYEKDGRVPLPSALSSGTNPLSQKLSQILSNSFVDPEISAALNILEQSGFVNSATSRRELAPNIAMQELETNKTVLDDYRHLVEEMRLIKMGLASMEAACDQMRVQAQAVKTSTTQLLEQSTFLQAQKKKVETKTVVLDAFRAKFLLEESEVQVLSSQSIVNEDFFKCLHRINAIHEDCSVLLASEDQTAGLEIMEAMNKHLDAGYAKLHRWILKELKSTTAGATEANVLLRQGLTVLSGRRDLYEKTLENVSESRRRVVAADFDQARVRGNLEANTDDAMRYVGDVLAWLHQAIATEREVIELILGSVGRRQSNTFPNDITTVSPALDYRAMQNELVDRSFSSILKPLQQRIDQVVVYQYDRVTSFRVAILIRFYRDLIDRVLERDATVTRSLHNMERSAISRFMQTTRNSIAAVNSKPPEVDIATLESPTFLTDTLDDLSAVLSILQESFLDTKEKEVEFTETWDQLLRQCIEVSVRMASELPQPTSSVFLLNCLVSLQNTLETVDFTVQQVEMCSSAAARCQQALIVEQHDYLLRNGGLITQIESLEENDHKSTISRLPEFQLEILKRLSKQLANFLPNALSDLSSRLSGLRDTDKATQINMEAALRFAKDYAQVEDAVLLNVEFGRSLLTLTYGEITRALNIS